MYQLPVSDITISIYDSEYSAHFTSRINFKCLGIVNVQRILTQPTSFPWAPWLRNTEFLRDWQPCSAFLFFFFFRNRNKSTDTAQQLNIHLAVQVLHWLLNPSWRSEEPRLNLGPTSRQPSHCLCTSDSLWSITAATSSRPCRCHLDTFDATLPWF